MGAPISLKDCTIRIKDGTSLAGAVNNGAGYPTTTTTLTVDGFTSKVYPGTRVAFANDPDVDYVVTASSPPTGATTSITITPGLTDAVVDNEVIAAGPNYIDVTIGDGNLEYSEKQNVEYILDRGVIDSTREGDDVPMEVSMDFRFDKITGATTDVLPTVEDALKFIGPAATWVATNNATCSSPRTVDIEVFETPPCSGVENQLFVFPDFAWEEMSHDFKGGTVSMSGKCNARHPEVSRDV